MSYRSRLTTSVGDCICPQSIRLAGSCSSPAPEPAFRKGVNVLLTRTEEIQKVHAHVFAGLAEAQEDQVFPDALLGSASSKDLAKLGEGFDGVLRVVVVPRYAVETQKGKELVAVLFKPLLELHCGFALQVGCGDLPIESLHKHQVLLQEMALQAVPINAFYHWLEQERKSQREPF